jgi:hypothetical protein
LTWLKVKAYVRMHVLHTLHVRMHVLHTPLACVVPVTWARVASPRQS